MLKLFTVATEEDSHRGDSAYTADRRYDWLTESPWILRWIDERTDKHWQHSCSTKNSRARKRQRARFAMLTTILKERSTRLPDNLMLRLVVNYQLCVLERIEFFFVFRISFFLDRKTKKCVSKWNSVFANHIPKKNTIIFSFSFSYLVIWKS